MGKDPAFLFYYQDFAYGTRQMSFEEKGCYIELLCEQADIGHLSIDDIKRALKSSFPIWETICCKFECDKSGKFYNVILESHIQKRRSYTESRLNNLHMGRHKAVHMEDVNVNEDVIKNIPKKTKKNNSIFKAPTVDEVRMYCAERQNKVDPEGWHAWYSSNGWKVGKNPMKDWKAAVRTWEARNNKPVDLLTETQKRNIAKFNDFEKRQMEGIDGLSDV